MSNDTKHEKHGLYPRIHASAVVMVLRREYAKGGFRGAKEAADQCISGLTDEQILKVASGEATLEGCSPDPITYREL